ncbi:MAG: STAS domain-containing protein [Cyclobacteriaceae bacterium]
MKYTANKKENYVIIALNEEKLDTTIAPELKSEFVTLQAEGFQHVILNMGQVKYSDSSGLSAVLVGNRLFGDSGSFIICEIKDHVQKLIKISMLDKVLNIVANEQQAVAAVTVDDIENQMNQNSGKE